MNPVRVFNVKNLFGFSMTNMHSVTHYQNINEREWTYFLTQTG